MLRVKQEMAPGPGLSVPGQGVRGPRKCPVRSRKPQARIHWQQKNTTLRRSLRPAPFCGLS